MDEYFAVVFRKKQGQKIKKNWERPQWKSVPQKGRALFDTILPQIQRTGVK